MIAASISVLDASSHLVAEVLELTLGLVGGVLGVVARLGELARRAVVVGVRLGVLDHPLDLVLGQAGAGLDLDLLLLAGAQVLRADTARMPLASMSNVTSTCGMPRGAGGMPVSWNLPSDLLFCAISRSPCSTWISTEGWLSSAVEKTSDFFVGIVVLRSISRVMTPPLVSMPSVSGVTSSSRTSLTSPASTPAWIAAPTATTSSGLTPRCGSLPVSSLTFSCTAGMRVMPPTRTTWSIVRRALVLGVVERLAHRRDDAVEQVGRELAELAAREARVEVLGARLVGRDERQVDLRLLRGRQLDLGLLGGLVEALQGHRVLRQVDRLVLLELAREPVDDRLVEVVAAEVVVTGGRLDLEDAVADLEHRHVERAAAEVEDEDRLVARPCRGRRRATPRSAR